MAFRPQFVAFGDSITQRGFNPGGWTASLADAYQRRVDVINRGFSGFNTRWVVPLLGRIFPPEAKGTVQLATIWFGANDAALPDRTSARQHVPVEEYKENLLAIVRHLQALEVGAIVVITPPPISEPHRKLHVRKTYAVELELPERTNEVAGQYADACCEVAAAAGLPCLNLWRSFQAQEGWAERLLSDGLHLTPEGQAAAYTQLQALISESFPHLSPDDMEWDGPEHKDIDLDDVPGSIEAWYAARQPAEARWQQLDKEGLLMK